MNIGAGKLKEGQISVQITHLHFIELSFLLKHRNMIQAREKKLGRLPILILDRQFTISN